MTVAPSQATPYVEVATFRACDTPKAQAEAPITGFELVDIEVVQPPDAQESLIAEPDPEVPAKDDEEEEEYRRRRGALRIGVNVWVDQGALC